jgi:hypothetical protein
VGRFELSTLVFSIIKFLALKHATDFRHFSLPFPVRGFSLYEKLLLVTQVWSAIPLWRSRSANAFKLEDFLYDSSPVDFINKMNINYSESLCSQPTPPDCGFPPSSRPPRSCTKSCRVGSVGGERCRGNSIKLRLCFTYRHFASLL